MLVYVDLKLNRYVENDKEKCGLFGGLHTEPV
jgi:hypothetical protein